MTLYFDHNLLSVADIFLFNFSFREDELQIQRKKIISIRINFVVISISKKLASAGWVTMENSLLLMDTISVNLRFPQIRNCVKPDYRFYQNT